MNTPQRLLQQIVKFGLILMMGVSMTACSKNWKEEVLLHDGQKIIVERVQHLGNFPTWESREKVILDETITFLLPGTNQKITWEMSFRDDVPEPNGINVMVLDIVNNTPYIAGYPAGCIAYNKWDRPNPPHIFYKYESNQWKRISLEDLPSQIGRANLVVGGPPAEGIRPFYTVEGVNAENHDIDEGPYKSILREPLANEWCPQYSSGPKAPIPVTPRAPTK